MSKKTITLLAITLTLCALCAWGGVGYMIFATQRLQEARENNASSHNDKSVIEQITATKNHAIVQNLQQSKSELERISAVDLLTAINRFELAGKPVNVALHVRDASTESLGKQNKGPVHAIGFSMEAEGTFAALVKTIQLISSLSLPVTVEQFDLSRTPVPENGVASRTPWHLAIRVRLLTTSNIAS